MDRREGRAAGAPWPTAGRQRRRQRQSATQSGLESALESLVNVGVRAQVGQRVVRRPESDQPFEERHRAVAVPVLRFEQLQGEAIRGALLPRG